LRARDAALLVAVGTAAGLACDQTVRTGTSVHLPMPGTGGAGILPVPDAGPTVDGGGAGDTRDANPAGDAAGAPDAGLLISGPLTLDDPVPIPGRSQAEPAVAFDGQRYLIVFTDQRAGRPDWSSEGELDIYGTRMRTDGTVLDPSGFSIATGFGDQHGPGIAFDGNNYLLVYLDHQLSSSGMEDDVVGLRLDRDGKPIDPAPFPISTSRASFAHPPAVVFNGTDFLVGWAGNVSGPIVRLVGTDGTPRSAPLPLSDPAGSPLGTDISIATDGTRFLAVSGLSGRFVEADGTAPAPAFPLAGAATNTFSEPIHVGYGGGIYLVAWSGADVDSRWVNATRVSASGAVLDSPPLQLGLLAHAAGVVDTTIVGGMAYDPAYGYFDLLWVSNNNIGRAFILSDGRLSDGFGAGGDPPDPGTMRDAPAITFQNEQFFLAWRSSYPLDDSLDLRSGLFGQLYSYFSFGPSFPLIETANQQLWPAAGSNGDGFLVAWSDTRNREIGEVYLGEVTDVYGTRLDAAGRVLDPGGIAIARAPSDQALPAVASDGDRYLVVWTDGRAGDTPGHIYGTFVTRDGAVTDPAGFQISDDANSYIQVLPSVAWGGSNYLVAWEARPGLFEAGTARAVLVSRDGHVMGTRTGFAVCGGCFGPKVAANADGTFLVVGMQASSTQEPTVATRVSSAGAVLDATPILLDPTTANRQGVAVASDGSDFLAVWAGSLGAGSAFRAAARISAGGDVTSTFALPLAYTFGPSVTFDGNQYLVAWRQTHDDGSHYVDGYWRVQADDDVMGVRISRSGEILDPAPFPIAATGADEAWPALASNGKGATLAAYTWPRLDPGFGSRRTGARIITSPAR